MKEIWYNITNFLKNLYNYRKILWEDRQFDYGYLLNLEKFKLELMINEFKDNPHIDHANDIHWISICIKLIDIIQERDSILDFDRTKFPYEYMVTKYVNINNAARYNLEININSDNVQAVMFAKDTLRQYKALYLYHKIRFNYILEWWD